jgi:urease accessory protein
MRSAPVPVRLWPALVIFLALSAGAHAHSTMPGAGDLVNGALHPVSVPAHVLILLGLGLALGQQVPFGPGRTLLVFAPCAAVALGLTTQFTFTVPQPALIGVALCAGTVVAMGRQIPFIAWAILVAAGAVCMGLDSGVEDGSGATEIRMLCGTLAGVVVFLFTTAFYTSMAMEQKRKWLHIALRVAGSWIVAISLLMLAFALRK